ncbi:hypothetical protein HYV79_00355 [Candidatus Woesearchaeota archaeon]|nr:hypothetical protein [Candidatus Woesearchaeota archaeon]
MPLYLKKWIVDYLKYRDSIALDILEFQENKDGYDYVVKRKRGEQFIIVQNDFKWKDIENKIKNDTVIVVEDTTKNIDELVKNWDKIINHKILTIVFVHSAGTKWVLNPYTHALISNKANLKQGLLSIASTSRGEEILLKSV